MNRRDFIKFGNGTVLSIAVTNFNLLSADENTDFWQLVQDRVDSFDIKRVWKYEGTEPTPLKNLPTKKPMYKLSYSHDFMHMLVAKEWGVTPAHLSSLPLRDQIDMYACCIAIQQISAFEEYKVWRRSTQGLINADNNL